MPVTEATIFTAKATQTARMVDLIRSRILDGTLRPGEAFPSERDLSEQYGVGRMVVRKALSHLSSAGLVQQKGPRLRTVTYRAVDQRPGWLAQAVALLTPPKMTGGAVAQRWRQYMTMGTMDHLRESNIHAVALSIGAIQEADLRRLATGGPMGALIPDIGDAASIPPAKIAEIFRLAGVPVVCYGGNPVWESYDRVVSDQEAGSYQLTQAMIQRGCRRIVQFWPKPWEPYWLAARQQGYLRAMRQAGLTPLPIVEFPYTPAPTDHPEVFAYAVKQVAGFLMPAMSQLNPDALLMVTDRDVPYAAAALRLHGKTPGSDLLLGGYDNYWNYCEERQFEPAGPLFTVDKGNDRMGKEMVKLLLDRVNGRLEQAAQCRLAPPKLIENPATS